MNQHGPLEWIGTPTVSTFKFSSIDNAKTAVLMARHCREREQSHPGVQEGSPTPEYQTAWDEHRAYATSSIAASVMFLEANINEVFITARMALEGSTPFNPVSGFPYVGGKLDRAEQMRLGGTWKLAERADVLEKYQFVLGLLGKERMDHGAAPFQPAKALVDVRNRLIHFKEGPHVVGTEPSPFEITLRRHLGGNDFRPHPYTTEQNTFFPDQFFGYAGCRWAWRTADGFAQEFHRRLSIAPAYQDIRQTLNLA